MGNEKIHSCRKVRKLELELNLTRNWWQSHGNTLDIELAARDTGRTQNRVSSRIIRVIWGTKKFISCRKVRKLELELNLTRNRWQSHGNTLDIELASIATGRTQN